MKNVLFCFIVSVLSPAPRDTHFQKYKKKSFLSLLVSIRLLTLYDTYYKVVQKHQKIQNFQNIKISIFSNKKCHF